MIVDGYNVIKSSGFSDDYQFNQLKNLRERFLILIKEYKQKSPHKITVVFDGSKTNEVMLNKEHADGIDIVYSAGGQTADDIIRGMVEEAESPREIMVVSSDKGITTYVRKMGASVSEAGELYGKIRQREAQGQEGLTKSDYFEKYVKGYNNNEEKERHISKGFSKRGKKDKRNLKLW